MPKDYVGHYIVTKEVGGDVDTGGMVNTIIAYVQNHEIYFKYEPQFFHGILMFGIIGYKRDHVKFKKDAVKMLKHFDCEIKNTVMTVMGEEDGVHL